MIATLLRMDAAFRRLPVWLSFTAAVGLLLMAVLSLSLYRTTAAGLPPAVPQNLILCFVVGWCAVSIYLMSPGARSRSGVFALGLPIPSRQLWMIHHLALFLAGMSVLAVTVGVAGLSTLLLARLEGPEILTTPVFVRLAIHLPPAVALAVALLQIPEPTLSRIPMTRRYRIYGITALVGTLGATMLLSLLPPILAPLPLIAALAIMLWRRGALSTTLVLAPREPRAQEGTARVSGDLADQWAAVPASHTGFSDGMFRLRTVHRAVAKKGMLSLIGYPVQFLLGMILSGFFDLWVTDGDMRFSLLIITVYMFLAFFGALSENLHRVDPLPIARSRLLGMLMLPVTITLVLGYAVGAIGLAVSGPVELVHFEKYGESYYSRIPASRCEIAWNGTPPENTSPWGESHAAWVEPLFRGSRAVLFSPFSTGEGPSLDFVALQLSRATEAVYGRGIPPREIAERYLTTDEDGAVVPRDGGLTLVRDHPDLRPRGAGPLFPLIMLVVGGGACVFIMIYLRGFRAGVGGVKRRVLMWILLGILLVLHLGSYALVVVGVFKPWVPGGVIGILARGFAEAVPGGSISVWILAGLALFGFYRMTERQFERIELVAPREDMS